MKKEIKHQTNIQLFITVMLTFRIKYLLNKLKKKMKKFMCKFLKNLQKLNNLLIKKIMNLSTGQQFRLKLNDLMKTFDDLSLTPAPIQIY